MCRSMWLNRGTAFGIFLGALLGVGGAVAWFTSREQPRSTASNEPPKTEPTQQVPPVAVATLQEKKQHAQKGCQGIAQAIEAYSLSPGNPTGDTPAKIDDLYHPPWGGLSFLKNGQAQTFDPWGNQYQIEPKTRPDGSPYVLVTTTSPDGVPISQFGIGPQAVPRE